MWKLFSDITGSGKRCINVPSVDINIPNKSFICSSSDAYVSNMTDKNASDFHGFNTFDVLKCLKCLKSSYSLGHDGLPAVVLRRCADIFCYPFTNIFNTSFSSNIVHAALKEVKNISVNKLGSANNVKSRPNAITSSF
ncbi:unnamed protein product [Trichobilharzia regenti]|nr:unnamed protein product [Trichobilharzia regenti]